MLLRNQFNCKGFKVMYKFYHIILKQIAFRSHAGAGTLNQSFPAACLRARLMTAFVPRWHSSRTVLH